MNGVLQVAAIWPSPNYYDSKYQATYYLDASVNTSAINGKKSMANGTTPQIWGNGYVS